MLGGTLVAGRVVHAAGALVRAKTPFVTLGATINYGVTASGAHSAALPCARTSR